MSAIDVNGTAPVISSMQNQLFIYLFIYFLILLGGKTGDLLLQFK